MWTRPVGSVCDSTGEKIMAVSRSDLSREHNIIQYVVLLLMMMSIQYATEANPETTRSARLINN